jgi:methylenetetrahydrofolate dehydrogenase (NADP+)/methenyltetrahydrofolate cyclohydrolase
MSKTVAEPGLALELAGRPIAQAIKAELAGAVAAFVGEQGYAPVLAMVLLGDDKPSRAYSRRIARTCDEVGLRYRPVELADDVDQEALRQALEALNGEREVAGVLVQMPLPRICRRASSMTPSRRPRISTASRRTMPAGCVCSSRRLNTPAGGWSCCGADIPLAGWRAVVVGRSNVVGKPMALLLLREHCTVTFSQPDGGSPGRREADILAVAIGRPFITADYPAGRGGDRLRHHRAADGQIIMSTTPRRARAGAITPVPGGTGLVTNALARNCLLAAQRQRRDEERDRQRQARLTRRHAQMRHSSLVELRSEPWGGLASFLYTSSTVFPLWLPGVGVEDGTDGRGGFATTSGDGPGWSDGRLRLLSSSLTTRAGDGGPRRLGGPVRPYDQSVTAL